MEVDAVRLPSGSEGRVTILGIYLIILGLVILMVMGIDGPEEVSWMYWFCSAMGLIMVGVGILYTNGVFKGFGH